MKHKFVCGCVVSMLVGSLALLSSSLVSAANYGPAGCGLGSMIFEPNSGLTQIFAATTNGTSGNQTFGITTGTSNCEPGGHAGAKGTEVFVAANRGAVAKDIARGSGETIDSVSRLAGCRDAKEVGRVLQQNFSSILPEASTSDAEVAAGVVRVLQSEKQLACGNLA